MVAMPAVSDALVRALVEQGVRRVFGFPGGGSSSELIQACGRAGLDFILTHSEAAAGYMASATYELERTPGVFLCGLGPGLASSVNAMAHALLDRTAVLLIADTHPAGSNTVHQRVEQEALMQPITKLSLRLHAKSALESLDVAIATALANPPGSVHLDLSMDVARTVIDEAPDGFSDSTCSLP